MNATYRLSSFIVTLMCGLLLVGLSAFAQERAFAQEKDRGAELVVQQQRIKAKFKQFEDKLLQLADAIDDPVRADLLRKAFSESKEKDIHQRIAAVAEALKANRLDTITTAVNGQTDVSIDLQKLLELLLSENRPENLTSEKERIKKYLQTLMQIRNHQREIEAQTRGVTDPKRIAPRQESNAERAKKLGEDIARNENAEGKGGEGKGAEGKGGEGKGGEGKGGEGKGGEGKGGEGKGAEGKGGEGKGAEGKGGEGKGGEGKGGEGKGGEGKGGEGKGGEGKGGEGKGGEGKGGEGKGGEGQGGEGKGGEGKGGQGQGGQGQGGEGEGGEGGQGGDQGQQPKDKLEQAQQRIQQAQERMRDAQQKLEKAQREGALEDEKKAREEIEEAIRDLEELLRQLREEEIKQLLKFLEARFKKMLEMQVEVYEGTLRLARIPEDLRNEDPRVRVQSGRLSRKESLIVLEADKALQLLREDGSAVAMPEAVEQMQDEMEYVVVRLAQVKVGDITQGSEEEIIAALEEMIAALKKAQKEMEAKEGQPSDSGEPQDPPLIDILAELKMLKSLQMRVNSRTKRYSLQLENADDEVGQAKTDDLRQALERLSNREDRIFAATRDIVTGKNK